MSALNGHLDSASPWGAKAGGFGIEPSMVEQARQWGYVLLAPHHPHCPGHAGLLFALHDKPGNAFFEPELVELWLRDHRGRADRTRLSCMPRPGEDCQICPGPICLHDRAGGRADFLTFGGSLSLVEPGAPQVYALRSPAPILELSDPTEPEPAHLAIETEALLSQMHARWGADDEGFFCELARVSPLALYAATLNSLIDHLRQSPALRNQWPEFYGLLQRERHWLRKMGRWPVPEIILEQILVPDPPDPP
jgi:hypothetical protein